MPLPLSIQSNLKNEVANEMTFYYQLTQKKKSKQTEKFINVVINLIQKSRENYPTVRSESGDQNKN